MGGKYIHICSMPDYFITKKKRRRNYLEKKFTTLKTLFPEQKLIIYVIKISLNVYSATVVSDNLFFRCV